MLKHTVFLILVLSVFNAFCYDDDEVPVYEPKITNICVFKINIDGQYAGDVHFGLYGEETPKTVENFRALCTGENGKSSSGYKLWYKGSPLHKIVPKFVIQGGDFTTKDGNGGESIYGRMFEDEGGFKLKHHAGSLSMANSGPNSNRSQFFISLIETSWLNGKHVVFGKVVRGWDVIKQIEKFGTKGGAPVRQVEIADAYEIAVKK